MVNITGLPRTSLRLKLQLHFQALVNFSEPFIDVHLNYSA